MNARLVLASLILFALTAYSHCQKQNAAPPKGTFELTDSETLWLGRYSNCDYGFYVLLSRGFVAHASLPPSPNHGFLIGLPGVGTREEVTPNDARYIWVNAEYITAEERSLRSVAAYELRIARAGERESRVISSGAAKLNGFPAYQFGLKFQASAGPIIREEVVAARGSISYQIGLKTTPAAYKSDRKIFEQVKAGFRLWQIHYCFNDDAKN